MPNWIGVDDRELLGVHIQVQLDTTQHDPTQAFQAVLNLPGGRTEILPIKNQQTQDINLPIKTIITNVQAEIEDFKLLPDGATASQATAISCLIVFKLMTFLHITLGSVPITASIHRPNSQK